MLTGLEYIIQSISPSIFRMQNDLKLQLAEQITVENKIQAAEQIYFNINFDISKDKAKYQPTAMITATNVQEDSSTSVLIDESNNSQALKNLPFSSGTHLMIDNSSWWRRKDHICLGRLKCIPLVTNESVIFNGIERENEDYRATLSDNEGYLVFGHHDDRNIKVYEFGKPYSLRGRSRWIFSEYTPEKVIRFDKLPGLIISLKEKIVKKAIVAKRESESLTANEYYLLVVLSRDLERAIS